MIMLLMRYMLYTTDVHTTDAQNLETIRAVTSDFIIYTGFHKVALDQKALYNIDLTIMGVT